jgi:hypothetical protein
VCPSCANVPADNVIDDDVHESVKIPKKKAQYLFSETV